MLTYSQCECFRTVAVKTAILQGFNMMQDKSIYIIKTTILAFTNGFKKFISFPFIIVGTLLFAMLPITYPCVLKSFNIICKGTLTPRNLFATDFPIISALVFNVFLSVFKRHNYSIGRRETIPLCTSM